MGEGGRPQTSIVVISFFLSLHPGQSCLEKRWKRSNEEACLNDEGEAPAYRVGDCQTGH